MKNLVSIIILFFSIGIFAQDAPEMVKYNAKNASNIFYYKLSEIPKEIKVKDDVTKNKTIKALRNYNDKIKKISFLNTPNLQELDLIVNSAGKQLYKDRDLALKVRKKIEATVLPIRDSVVVYEKTLNTTLKEFLSKKQFKKWLKYQKREKRKLIPQQKSRNTRQPQNMNRTRGMGMGGRRF